MDSAESLMDLYLSELRGTSPAVVETTLSEGGNAFASVLDDWMGNEGLGQPSPAAVGYPSKETDLPK